PAAADLGARLVAPATLRDAPGGAVVGRVGPRTEFGSPRVLPVVRRQGPWLAVIATELANGALGWVPASRVRLVREPVRIDVDRLALHGTHVPATVGAADSLGCLRARSGDMRRLLRLARLGARVHITG